MIQLRLQEPNIGVKTLCSLFGKTRHAYYSHLWRLDEVVLTQDIVLQEVAVIRNDLPNLGTRKTHLKLKFPLLEHGISIGRDYLFDLLASRGMLIKKRRRRSVTTNSNHWMKKYDNLIKEMVIVRANQLWVSDITYLKRNDLFVYLSLVTDAYSHQIVGYQVQNDLSALGCIGALEMALSQRKSSTLPLIHHSDRGSQYCSKAYIDILKNDQISISMTQNGDPYENAIAERVNGILKGEFSIENNKGSMALLKLKINKAIYAYNHLRPHDSCDSLTPVQAHQRTGILNKKWKNYRKIRWECKREQMINSRLNTPYTLVAEKQQVYKEVPKALAKNYNKLEKLKHDSF